MSLYFGVGVSEGCQQSLLDYNLDPSMVVTVSFSLSARVSVFHSCFFLLAPDASFSIATVFAIHEPTHESLSCHTLTY